MILFLQFNYFIYLFYKLFLLFLFISCPFTKAFFYSMTGGGCSCPTVVCPPSPPCPSISSENCHSCGKTSSSCGGSNCGGSTSGGCSGGCTSGNFGGCGGNYPSKANGCAPGPVHVTVECSKNNVDTTGCGGTSNTNCSPQKQSNGYSKTNFGGGGYSSSNNNNLGQPQQTGCSTENCLPPVQQQNQQIPTFTNSIPPPPQHYVAPSLPTAECQSAMPNECNNIFPHSSQQQTFSSGAGGTYSQRNNEGDRELLQQNKGEGFSSGNDNSGFEQGNYESQTTTFSPAPFPTYTQQQQQLPEQQTPIQPPPIDEPPALPPLPPNDDSYLSSSLPSETETTTSINNGEENNNNNNYKRDPPSINVSGGKGNGAPNVQGNKLATANQKFQNVKFPMDLYGDDKLAELIDYEEEADAKTSTTLTTTTSKKVFAVVPPEKATVNFGKGENEKALDKDDILSSEYSDNSSFKKVHVSPHSSDKLYSKLGTENSKCSSETLRTIMHENIVVSPTISKQLIFSAGRLTFGASIDVICSRNRFSYTVISSKIFCETSRGPVTCFAFLQP